MDCIDHALQYRKNQVSFEEVKKLFNSTLTRLQKKSKFMNGGVVFALAGPEIEFAIICNYTEEHKPAEDVQRMLLYMDPVGVVFVGDENKVFITFKGHEWAEKYATQIVEQANASVPVTTWR